MCKSHTELQTFLGESRIVEDQEGALTLVLMSPAHSYVPII